METVAWITGVVGAGLIAVLGWALHSLVNSINARFDDLRADLNSRMDHIETRMNGTDACLTMMTKDLGEVVGWVRAHGPLGQTG